ncbi:MAG: hypothetical protein U0S48_19780 [Solirubrobacteraceae bacterium]
MRRTLLLTLLLVLLPAAAAHASAAQVIRDCTDDGVLSGSYSQKELRTALANLPSDVDEYTNCRDVIRAAQLRGGGGSATGGGTGGPSATGGGTTPSGAGGTGGGATAPKTGSSPGAFGGFSGYPADPVNSATAQERRAVDEAQAVPVENTAVAAAALPTPLIVALALGALGLLILGALDLRRRVVARRDA